MNFEKIVAVQAALLANYMNAVNAKLTQSQEVITAAVNNPDANARFEALEGLSQQLSPTGLSTVTLAKKVQQSHSDAMKSILADPSKRVQTLKFYLGDREYVTRSFDASREILPTDLVGLAKQLFDALNDSELNPRLESDGRYAVLTAGAVK